METQEGEIKLNFLVSGSYDALPSSYLKLRSYLNIHSSNLAKLHGLKLPKCFTNSNLTCTQCFLPWSQETCSIKLVPVKKRKKARTKGGTKKPGTKLRKNHLVLKCKVCNSRSRFYLQKTIKTKDVVKAKVKGKNKKVKNENKVIERKKKKKKKDKTCGLRYTLITSVKKSESPKNCSNKTESTAVKPSKTTIQTVKSNKNANRINAPVNNSASCTTKAQVVRKKDVTYNPTKPMCKSTKKQNINLRKLQKLVQEREEPVKKTLKDFLTLV